MASVSHSSPPGGDHDNLAEIMQKENWIEVVASLERTGLPEAHLVAGDICLDHAQQEERQSEQARKFVSRAEANWIFARAKQVDANPEPDLMAIQAGVKLACTPLYEALLLDDQIAFAPDIAIAYNGLRKIGKQLRTAFRKEWETLRVSGENDQYRDYVREIQNHAALMLIGRAGLHFEAVKTFVGLPPFLSERSLSSRKRWEVSVFSTEKVGYWGEGSVPRMTQKVKVMPHVQPHIGRFSRYGNKYINMRADLNDDNEVGFLTPVKVLEELLQEEDTPTYDNRGHGRLNRRSARMISILGLGKNLVYKPVELAD